MFFYALIAPLIPKKLIAMCIVHHYGRGMFGMNDLERKNMLEAFDELSK